MRTPIESRIKNLKNKKGAWSITEGDYIRNKDHNDITYRKIKSREKKTKIFLTMFFVLLGYGALIAILSLVSKY